MKDGDLMIKTPNLKAAQTFLKAKYIDIVKVNITLHKTLNSCQGRIFSRKIIDIPQEDLLLALKDQKVTDVRKITKKEGDKLIYTGAAVLTFDLIRRPETLKLGWERVRVDEHISNPMRCVICQRLGHTKNRCTRIELCRECGLIPPHETCLRKYCINCENDTHTSYDSACPSFLKHKSVNKIKADRRCTVREAWKIFNDNPPLHTIKPFKKPSQTFSEVLRSGISSEQNASPPKTIEKTRVNQINQKDISTSSTNTNNIHNNKLDKTTVSNDKQASVNKSISIKQTKNNTITQTHTTTTDVKVQLKTQQNITTATLK